MSHTCINVYRSSNWADLSDRIEKSWTDCLRQKTLLKIQIVNSLEESEQPKKSMNHRAGKIDYEIILIPNFLATVEHYYYLLRG